MDVQKKKQGWFSGRRRLVAVVGVALLGLAMAMSISMGNAIPSAERSGLWMDEARMGSLSREVRATGVLVPKESRWITAGVDGLVQELAVQPGERVQADTVIIRLFNPATRSTSEKARAALAGAEAEVAAKRAELELQRLEQEALLAKAESAFRITQAKTAALARAEAAGVVSKLELNQSQITMEQDARLAEVERQRAVAMKSNFEAQMRAVTALRDEFANALETARREEAHLEVVAGIAGVIQEVGAELGEQVDAGARLARVAKHDVLIARLQVPESQATDLVLDLPVQVGAPGGPVRGRIARIDPAVREGRVAVDVFFQDALPAGVRSDLAVEGRILLEEVRNVISIGRPATAVNEGAGTLFVMKPGSNVAERTSVRFGAGSTDRIEVRSGVEEGDRVILSDTGRWSRYQQIRIN